MGNKNWDFLEIEMRNFREEVSSYAKESRQKLAEICAYFFVAFRFF